MTWTEVSTDDKANQPVLGVSIVIRALNEEKFLPECLRKIKEQSVDAPIEIILVDSGSVDRTVEIALSHGCKVVEIKKSEFTFGRALNIGVEQSKFNVIVAISAHCIPVGKKWLSKLVSPIISGHAHMTYGSHLASKGSRSSEINYFHEKFCHSSGLKNSPLLNNGNSAFLKSLWSKRSFNEFLPAQEDMEFALWHMKNSFAKLYFCGRSKVVHHHNDRNKTLFNRLYRELCVEFSLGQKNHIQMTMFFISIPYLILKDLITSYKKKAMMKALKGIFAFRVVQAAAYFQAYRHHQSFVSNGV